MNKLLVLRILLAIVQEFERQAEFGMEPSYEDLSFILKDCFQPEKPTYAVAVRDKGNTAFLAGPVLSLEVMLDFEVKEESGLSYFIVSLDKGQVTPLFKWAGGKWAPKSSRGN